MEQIQLASTGKMTSRLGFGCSSLMGAMGRKESLATLEVAFEAGIRHFDVAPMYGFGQAEGCLGEFLARHRGDVTVTTKYGIPPAKSQGLISLARSIARPVVKVLPGLKRGLTNVAAKTTQGPERAAFTPVQATESLERSLSELKTDHIDIWVLHEATNDDLSDDMLRMMQDAVASGKVGAFGVGSERAKIEAILKSRPEYCPVAQFEWSVVDAPVAPMKSFRIHHRALTDNFRDLHHKLIHDLSRCAEWSKQVDADLANREMLASLMLKVALIENPGSIILFSSKNPAHVRTNVAAARDQTLDAPAKRLYQLVQAGTIDTTAKERMAG